MSHTESEGAVGGVIEDDSHMTANEEEVPIDEDLFATEDLDIENLDLEDDTIEPEAVDWIDWMWKFYVVCNIYGMAAVQFNHKMLYI